MSKCTKAELDDFFEVVRQNRYDFTKLVYLLWDWGEGPLKGMAPTDWHMEEWDAMSHHFLDPTKRDLTYSLAISSGNGSRKTTFGAMTAMMVFYTQQVKCRLLANTKDQVQRVIWPEYLHWYNQARYSKAITNLESTQIKIKGEVEGKQHYIQQVIWNDKAPHALSGVHNAGKAVFRIMEEAALIPYFVWDYTDGMFTDANTMKIRFAFANSSDPESHFENCMKSPNWRSRRINIETLDFISESHIKECLEEAGWDRDSDSYRRKVRGLPFKTGEGAVIKAELVHSSIQRGEKFDRKKVKDFPVILAFDGAWRMGDENCLWMRQGYYACMLECYRLPENQTHVYNYQLISRWEQELEASAVWIDHAEGTGIYSLAEGYGKLNWQLVNFSSLPYLDGTEVEGKSIYANRRAQMYFKTRDWLINGGIIDSRDKSLLKEIQRELCTPKEVKHPQSGRKLIESKDDIRERIRKSPDKADGLVISFAYPEFTLPSKGKEHLTSYKMADFPDPLDPDPAPQLLPFDLRDFPNVEKISG